MATIDMALGGVEKIIKVASEIKKAVETAKRNREEVVYIQERVETVEHIVLVLHETDVTTNLSMERALENLHRALHRALELVQDCEKRNRVCLLCAAKDVSQKLLRVQDDISHKLMQVTLAITVHITMELGKKQANPPSRKRRRPVCRVPHRPQDQLQQAATAIQTNARFRRKKPDLSTGLQDEGRPQRKFGDWDAHPASAERYTGRFNKLRDDKKMTDPRVGTLAASAFRNNSGTGDAVLRSAFKSNSDGYTYTPCLKKFSLSELNVATNNFSDDRVIGKGGLFYCLQGCRTVEAARLVTRPPQPWNQSIQAFFDIGANFWRFIQAIFCLAAAQALDFVLRTLKHMDREMFVTRCSLHGHAR